MRARLKDILEKINSLVTFKIEPTMADDDFIANIEAINLLCNVYDELGLDRTGLRDRMDELYPEFSRRICAKDNIQHALPLIKALYSYIYGRRTDSSDRGPQSWRDSLIENCVSVIDAYKKIPLTHSSEYIYALLTASRLSGNNMVEATTESLSILDRYISDIDNVPVDEQIRRVWACNYSKELVAVNCEKWDEITRSIISAEISHLDDKTFVMWCDITGLSPYEELKRRSCNSRLMQVEYLSTLVYSEIRNGNRTYERQKLNRRIKTLEDNLIREFTSIRITADMPVSTLYAMETVFDLRLQLAQVSGEYNLSTYETLCRFKFEDIAKALTKKYRFSTTLNEKIEILERLEIIELQLNADHNLFVLEETQILSELSELTDFQRLRLDYMANMEPENWEALIDNLLPQAKDAFDIKTLLDIDIFGSESQRKSILDLYAEIFDQSLAMNDSGEIARLLTAASQSTRDPLRRDILCGIAQKAASLTSITMPEKQIIPVAAEIFDRMEAVTGMYDGAGPMTACHLTIA